MTAVRRKKVYSILVPRQKRLKRCEQRGANRRRHRIHRTRIARAVRFARAKRTVIRTAAPKRRTAAAVQRVTPAAPAVKPVNKRGRVMAIVASLIGA